MKLSDFNYDLPKELIAQYPSEKRDESRLLVLNRKTGEISHKVFKDIVSYFNPGDVLIVNKTKVNKARLIGRKETGAKIEILMLDSRRALVKPLKRIKPSDKILIGDDYCKLAGIDNGIAELEFSRGIGEIMEKYGKVPLPPYIKRETEDIDTERYQTIYADPAGSVAAPTAGLHFTKEIFSRIKEKGTKISEVTLHVSWGTFAPVRSDDIREHKMENEYFELAPDAADAVNSAKRRIAVGTTSVRVLESSSVDGEVVPKKGSTDIFIYPGYKFRAVDAMVTNFHMPGTTLVMLVCAFAGRDLIMKAYDEARKEKYRFASYGDAMLIL